MFLLIFYVLLALAVSFLCSLLESTLLTVTPASIEAAKQRGATWGTRMERLKNDIDRPLSAILTLNTVSHTMGAAGAGAEYARLYGNAFEAIFAGFLTLAMLVVTEIIPKSLGAHFANELARPVSWLLPWLIRLLTPLVWLSRKLTGLISFGKAKQAPRLREELLAVARLGERAGDLRKREGSILRNLMELSKMSVRDIMTPRPVVFCLPDDTRLAEFPDLIAEHPYSRVPIYREKLDNMTGFVLRTDVLLALHTQPEDDLTLESLRRPLEHVPDTLQVDQLFERFIKERHQIMLVIDEFGSTVGLVSLEDVVETIFGIEILDEQDKVDDLRKYARTLWRKRAAEMGLGAIDTASAEEKS